MAIDPLPGDRLPGDRLPGARLSGARPAGARLSGARPAGARLPDCLGPVASVLGPRFPGTDSGYENGGNLPFFNDSGRPGGPASAPALFRVNNYRKNDMA